MFSGRLHPDGAEDEVADPVEAPDQGWRSTTTTPIGRAIMNATFSGICNATDFGTSSPRTTWSKVIRKNATATETVRAKVTESVIGSHANSGSMRCEAPAHRSSQGRGSPG